MSSKHLIQCGLKKKNYDDMVWGLKLSWLLLLVKCGCENASRKLLHHNTIY